MLHNFYLYFVEVIKSLTNTFIISLLGSLNLSDITKKVTINKEGKIVINKVVAILNSNNFQLVGK